VTGQLKTERTMRMAAEAGSYAVVSATAQSQKPDGPVPTAERTGPMWMLSDPAALTGVGALAPRAERALSNGRDRKAARRVLASTESFVSTHRLAL
jgi:hypothetical protein